MFILSGEDNEIFKVFRLLDKWFLQVPNKPALGFLKKYSWYITFFSDLSCNRNQIPFQLGVEQEAKEKKIDS